MAAYTPSVSVMKRARSLKVEWHDWEGYGDRIKNALLDDGGAFTNYTTQANNDTTNDVNLLPAIPVVNDAFYFGSLYPFIKIMLNMGTAGAGVWTLIWEYYNGSAWVALSKVTIGNSAQFKGAAGERVIEFAYPIDWAQVAVNSITCYWVRARVSAYTSIATQPKARKIRIENIAVKDYDIYCATQSSATIADDIKVVRNAKSSPAIFPWSPGTDYFVWVRPNGWTEPGTISEVYG
jgi:hypothetical protein